MHYLCNERWLVWVSCLNRYFAYIIFWTSDFNRDTYVISKFISFNTIVSILSSSFLLLQMLIELFIN